MNPTRHIRPLLLLAAVVSLSMAFFGFAPAAHAVTGAHLVFTQQPSAATGGVAFASQPVVAIEDDMGNTLPDSTTVRLSLVGGGSGALLCNHGRSVAAVAGVATFANCRIGAPATYRLLASASGVVSAASDPVMITVGPAAKLAFTTQPGNGTGGVPLATQPVVSIQDAGGNPVSDTATVRLAVASGGNGVLSCVQGRQVVAVGGVASFAGCKLDVVGAYRLEAVATGLQPAFSDAFMITVGPAERLAFMTEPGDETLPGNFGPQPVVAILDAGRNLVADSTLTVRLAIASGGIGVLSCTHGRKAVAAAGVATFAGCHIAVPGAYVLRAVSDGLMSADSGPVTVSP